MERKTYVLRQNKGNADVCLWLLCHMCAHGQVCLSCRDMVVSTGLHKFKGAIYGQFKQCDRIVVLFCDLAYKPRPATCRPAK